MGLDLGATILGLDALTLRQRIAEGMLSVAAVAEACLAQIARQEPGIQAWAWHDPGFVRAQAAELDRHRQSGRPLGALHGLPVGIKDVIDTARIPTANGCAVDAGRVPARDAFVVARLKAEGALILGKTVTTELAFMDAGPTRNPHDPARTPGGSSSGSAAAVASGMCLLAIGTQTGGSVIRPASFCGVTGFKPSFGAIPRTGVLRQSQSLDTIGVFARTPLDAALVAETLFGCDAGDPDTAPAPHPQLLAIAQDAPPVRPTLALIQPPGWDRTDPELRDAFTELADFLGEAAFDCPLPTAFDAAARQRQIVNCAEMARNYFTHGRDGRDRLGPRLRAALSEGEAITARDYLAALDWRAVLQAGIDEVFARCDAILAPAAPGPAPEGLESTGDAIFNGLWTFLGTPAITLPVFTAASGMPMGLQLIGPRGQDARLLRTANWLWTELTENGA